MQKSKLHNDMITWGGFNLIIFKVKQIYYERIEIFYNKTWTTNILLLPRVENLLSRPCDSSEDSITSTSTCDFETPLKSFKSP